MYLLQMFYTCKCELQHYYYKSSEWIHSLCTWVYLVLDLFSFTKRILKTAHISIVFSVCMYTCDNFSPPLVALRSNKHQSSTNNNIWLLLCLREKKSIFYDQYLHSWLTGKSIWLSRLCISGS